MKHVQELIDILELERIEVNLFRGQSRTVGSPRVFGGQVLAQALSAATRTIEADRTVHSIHAYFVLPGDLEVPIIFEVDRIRDGGSFSTRAVKAIQHGEAIFHLSASFQKEQQGFDHQIEMPPVTPPEALQDWVKMAEVYGDKLPEGIRRILTIERPLEFRPVEFINPFIHQQKEPLRHVWFKTRGTIASDDPGLHRLILAYASDYNLLTTALLPHGQANDFQGVQLASLDHAMWFHRPFRADEWLLYAIDSPSASGARGFSRGNIFNQSGDLVASVVQEGLMRLRV
ncbi:MAG: acyl-CoA thioesterase II [Bacteroidota bacterium]